MRKAPYLWSIILLGLVSCTNYRLNYTAAVDDWHKSVAPDTILSYQVFLIGDAGKATSSWTPPTLPALAHHLQQAGPESAVVFLGDNIYPDGMASKSTPYERAYDESALDAQLEVLKNYDGKAYFIAGNHDWAAYGIDGLDRQEDYIEEMTDKQARFYPRPGCGDPVEIELTDELTLLLLDSQWWLANWAGESKINDGCEVKSKADFAFMLQEAIKGNRRKELLIAMHHPIYSNGQHGGDFSVSEHLFPLRDLNEDLYIPLPVLGSALRLLQSSIGTRQDIHNATYRDLRLLLLQQSKQADRVVFASGHEHNLQFWERDNQHFIVSGSGSRREPTKTGDGAEFAYGQYGFARLDYFADGQVWANYYAITDDQENGKLVFRYQIRKASEGAVEKEPTQITSTFSAAKQRRVKVSQMNFDRSPVGEKLWGKHYRAAYRSEVDVPEIDLEALGLIPVKRGGGFQTNSLRLEDPVSQRQYNLRSIDKDAGRTVPAPLNTNIILDIVGDNFSASHPLAALAVAPLAEAVDVYHTNPQLVYLPSQAALGVFNDDYAEALYLFEERPDDEAWEDAPFFGSSDDIISTFDVLEETREEHDERIDQHWTLKSRLFDLLIGDWDRHDDQWRWAKIEKGEVDYYRPIPRDRDQAFANYDGFIFAIARQLSVKSKQWRPYTGQVGRTHWATYNAYLFDQTFLTGMEWRDWRSAIQHLQTHLTDAAIDSAFNQAWPEPFLSRDAPAIKRTLRARRDGLVDIARDYYEFLAQEVDILGTDEKDLFVIERLPDSLTRVRVFNTNKKGERESLLYDRYFRVGETRAIHCYGLADDDIFQVRGEVDLGPRVDLIGGEGEDTFDDQSKTFKHGPRVDIYDFKVEKSKLLATSDSRDLRSHRAQLNLYDRRGADHQYDFNLLLPILGYNPDDQLLLGFNGTYTRHAFHKKPFSSRHRYGAQASLATGGFKGYYSGNFTDVIGPIDFQLDFYIQTPLYANNYYGLGNETQNFETVEGRSYHRVRKEYRSIAPQLAWQANDNFQLLFGPRYTSAEIERTPDRFLETQVEELAAEVFDDIGVLSAELSLAYRNIDELNFPTRGLKFRMKLARNHQVNGDRFNFSSFDTELVIYKQLDRRGKLVLASRAGLQHRFGENADFPFYWGATLGGQGSDGNLRGFRRDRFIGRTAFFHNSDLRWKITFWNNKLLPMSIGVLASFDYGKVSLKEIESELIHYSYGPGIFLSPFDSFTVHVGAYKGDEINWRWLVGGAFFF